MQDTNTLKSLRVNAGLSQSELAKKSGVNLRTIQGYESGNRDLYKAAGETLLRLARSLGCSIEDLLGVDLSRSDNCAGANQTM